MKDCTSGSLLTLVKGPSLICVQSLEDPGIAPLPTAITDVCAPYRFAVRSLSIQPNPIACKLYICTLVKTTIIIIELIPIRCGKMPPVLPVTLTISYRDVSPHHHLVDELHSYPPKQENLELGC